MDPGRIDPQGKPATDDGEASSGTGEASPPRRAGPLMVARAVLASFLGIRKARDLDADASAITPVQAIIGGLVGAAILIASLLGLVIFITRG